MAQRIITLKNLRRPAPGNEATLGARPTGSTDGVDITDWNNLQGMQGSLWWSEITLVCTVATSTIAAIADAPSGAGVELWVYGEDGDGTDRWSLENYVNGGITLQVVQNMGLKIRVEWMGKYKRFALAGTITGGTIKYSAMPIEAHWNF